MVAMRSTVVTPRVLLVVQLLAAAVVSGALVVVAAQSGSAFQAPTQVPNVRLLFIGDAGEAADDTLDALRVIAQVGASHTVVVFLGDNAYPEGMTETRQGDAERRIDRQLVAVEGTEALAWFIPGNHDWDDGGPEGLAALRAQAAFIGDRARFVPAAGCPGPAVQDFPREDPAVRMIALDTQWWLHDWEVATVGCLAATREAVIEQLAEALDTELPTIVAAHHPLATHGPHGGYFNWQDHLFPLTRAAGWLWVPLPGVGSAYPLVRRLAPSDQDLGGGDNVAMREAFAVALRTRVSRSPVFYVAGHEHSLQILRSEIVDYVLVTGAGSRSKVTPVGRGPDTVFAASAPGFMALDVFGETLRVSVLEPQEIGGPETVFTLEIPVTEGVR